MMPQLIKGKLKAYDGKKTSGKGDPTSIKCYKYGKQVHRYNECENKELWCYKCGKFGRRAPECKNHSPTFFNC